MKKLMLTAITMFLIVAVKGQKLSSWFIDSVAERHSPCKTLLLFAELHDTTDAVTGRVYSQRISFYFDRIHKQIRDVDVYNFDKKVSRRTIQKAFEKQKNIPASTHIVYTFFNCNLVKVKLTPSETLCKECLGEYYFNDNMVTSKKEKSVGEQTRNFIIEANFYFAKLEMADSSFTRCMR